ncbi:MAG: hypothetical protein WAP03_17145 [Methylorubrum rhodinum]|uniref:hypothetical protein n=1 Tax=Methylorubrum rhodinum TaxID=29428 RepID=UPI003BAE7294
MDRHNPTPYQIAELIKYAQSDEENWQMLKDRELELEKDIADAAKQGLHYDDPRAVLDPPSQPCFGEILEYLVGRRFGCEFIYPIRKAIREELGLPV